MSRRKDLRAQGEALRKRLFGRAGRAAAGRAAPGFSELMSEVAYGAVWHRPGLALGERMICSLAALCAVQRLPSLKLHVGAALELGTPPEAVLEVFIQIGIYAGFSASEEAIDAAVAVFEERGVAVRAAVEVDDSREALMQRGLELLEKLHGERGQQGYAAPDNPFTRALYPLAIEYGYGAIWHRAGLSLRERALVSLAGFTALRMEDQLKKFGQSALNAGLSKDEIIEAVVQTAPFSGFAPALNALRWLSEVL
jgi:alkylhydroperoxidase/carboxymuconolactone decarboxylase family protein YurZ